MLIRGSDHTISIVIVNYNGELLLKNCFESMLAQTIPFDEIILVDNASSDGSLETASRFSRIKQIPVSMNIGYTGGANLGIRHSTSSLVVVANSDIYLKESFNEAVITKYRAEPQLDIMSPLILRFDEKTVDSAGQVPSAALHPKERCYNRPRQNCRYSEGPVFSVCGAVTVFKRKALDRLAVSGEFYDEDFFMFWEDFDIGWRANLYGMNIQYNPKAVAFHFRSATLEKKRRLKLPLSLARPALSKYHLIKNRHLLLIKNFRWKRDWHHLPFIFCKDLLWLSILTLSAPKTIILLLKSGHFARTALKKRKLIKENE